MRRPSSLGLSLALLYVVLLTSRKANGAHDAPHCDHHCRQGLKIAESLRSGLGDSGSSGKTDALHHLASIEERDTISQYSDMFESVPQEVSGNGGRLIARVVV